MEALCILNMIEMKRNKVIFATITLGLSFYFALAITKKVFAKKEIAANKIENLQENSFQDGDIFFQTSQSEQCEAVRIATNSKFSHCGILLVIDGQKMIFEAVQPVKLTPIQDWITHGKDNKYVVSRLKNAKTVLTENTLTKMKKYGHNFLNKDYDGYFNWSDEQKFFQSIKISRFVDHQNRHNAESNSMIECFINILNNICHIY